MIRPLLVTLALAVALAACAPRTETSEPATPPQTVPQTPTPAPPTPTPPAAAPPANPAAQAVERTARQAYRLMEREYGRTGLYSVNVLVSGLELPSGTRWQLENLAPETYALRFTSDEVPDRTWLVTPEGVVTQSAESNEIY